MIDVDTLQAPLHLLSVAMWQPCELLYTCYLLTYYRPSSLGARHRLGHDATNSSQQRRKTAHSDAVTSLLQDTGKQVQGVAGEVISHLSPLPATSTAASDDSCVGRQPQQQRSVNNSKPVKDSKLCPRLSVSQKFSSCDGIDFVILLHYVKTGLGPCERDWWVRCG